MTELRTTRLILRPPTMTDRDAIIEACSDPDIARFTAVPEPYTRADAEYFITDIVAQSAADGLPVFLITTHDGQLVGAIDLHKRNGNVAEIGYWAHRDFRGRGFLTEAATALLAHAFNDLELATVHIQIRSANLASLALARRLGFTMHAVVPGLISLKGEQHDGWIGSLTASDFLAGTRPRPATVHDMVVEFHQVYSMVIGKGAAAVDHPDMAMRLRLIAEEFCELIEAVRGREAAETVRSAFETIDVGPTNADLIATADALGDLTYVIYGMAILANIPLDSVITEIHRSNLTKLGPDGKPVLRADGKVGKGPHFQPPNLAAILHSEGETGGALFER